MMYDIQQKASYYILCLCIAPRIRSIALIPCAGNIRKTSHVNVCSLNPFSYFSGCYLHTVRKIAGALMSKFSMKHVAESIIMWNLTIWHLLMSSCISWFLFF